MSDRKTPAPSLDDDRLQGLAHETRNAEQDERGEQAQDVAADALDRVSGRAGGTESRKPPATGLDDDGGDAADLIDIMRHMEETGTIDNSAFAGEPEHDDEPTRYRDSGKDALDEDEDDDDAGPDALHETRRP
ncbi:hypothetical protein [Porphyrobacter sp. SLTP]|uniref:hypothetical protein n=1 Tax=Porphyrobacter sp. SLTP TaxID=2683266 RepID=UPI0018F8BE53|nr:hypothetical protein [Porphyrobacter sp. SLTP]